MTKIISGLKAWTVLTLFMGTACYAGDFESTKSRLPLMSGMTFSEVQALWGEPSEKIEQEIKRQAFWSYPSLRNAPASTLTFKNGTLRSTDGLPVLSNSAKHSVKAEYSSLPSNQYADVKTTKPRVQSFMALSDQKMLTDILKEVPSEPDGAEGAGGKGASPANMGLPPPPQPIE